ncbi:hypothetical protein NDU88_005821 [Pleurodeles waltl]|uniref:Uncharacterized protein n=1 Tax=Pleurodeles waltl TaxID=8319 RepID=A0AAV7QI95_PLEWA|nr:hypothetical protein NDU88_005821 [Pleurodeles waltl]
MGRIQALYLSGAGLVAPPAEWAPLIPVRARPCLRRRAVRSLWDPRGSGPRGTATPFLPLSGHATLGDVLPSPVHGHPAFRAPGPHSALFVPAADSRGPGPAPPPRGRKQPRLLQARRGGGTSLRDLRSCRRSDLARSAGRPPSEVRSGARGCLSSGVVTASPSPGVGPTGAGKHPGSPRTTAGDSQD